MTGELLYLVPTCNGTSGWTTCHELHNGHQARVGQLTLTSRAVAHGIPAFAVTIETAYRSLVYTRLLKRRCPSP